jgi:hypothetical protein
MTQIVVVQPGQSTVIASGPQFGVKYELLGPDGARVTFNDPSDADYVGWITNISGLDSPDVRESADDLIGDDGGIHGDFFHGRRPIVIEGQIDNQPAGHHWEDLGAGPVPFTPTRVRNIRMTSLARATNAMRQDAQLRWIPEGGMDQQVSLRRQQPLRIGGAYNKTFQAAMVAADPRIYASLVSEVRFFPGVEDTVSNLGTMRTPPVVTIYGPTSGAMSSIEFHNHSTGQYIVLAPSYTLLPGQYLVLDFRTKTITRETGADAYDKIEFASTTWFQIEPGDNELELHGSGTTTGASAVVRWQDAWV